MTNIQKYVIAGIAVVLFVGLGWFLWPSKPSIELSTENSVQVGQLVRFKIDSNASSFKWLVSPATENFEVYNDGKNAVFSSPLSGDYTFTVACAKGGSVDLVSVVVTVQGDVVNPPAPGPEPIPAPSVIAQKIPQWYAGIKSKDKKMEATKLAESFDKLAVTQFATADELVKETQKANRQVLGRSLVNWTPFLEKLQIEMKLQARAGVLVTLEQHQQLWQQIAIALRNVK